MRKSFFISLALVSMAAFAGHAFAVGFTDTIGTDYETAFASLQTSGVIRGYSDGTARPGVPLNRAEAVKIILEARGTSKSRLAWYAKHMPPIGLFNDTNQKAWYGPYLETAFEEGMVTGYADGTFRPAQYLRTEEAVAMLVRSYGMEKKESIASLSDHIENRADSWFTGSINVAIDKNIVMQKGRLKLGTAITRGQFADMVYRLNAVKAGGKVAYDGPEPQTQVQRVASAVPTYVPTHGVVPQPNAGVTTGVSVNQGAVVARQGGAVSPGVQQTSGAQVPSVAQTTNKTDHPYASEKFFAVSIPKLGINDLAIIHPEDAVSQEGVLAPLKLGIGHLFSYPGGGGKIMLYGHSSGYPWDVSEFTKIFRKVNELEAGDRVYVTYSGKLYVYEVSREQTILTKNTNDAFRDEGLGEELILFTCWPPDSITQRYLVHAVPVETVALQ